MLNAFNSAIHKNDGPQSEPPSPTRTSGVIPAIVTTITITSNGNSPETKMLGNLMINAQRRIITHAVKPKELIYNKILKDNSSQLALNERYRRLIPYMTFYYANDLVSPTTEPHNTDNVEVEKAEIIETRTVTPNDRQPRVIYTSQRQKNIPRYQGNRLTQFNIASANPIKLYYKDLVPVAYHNSPRPNPGYHSSLAERPAPSVSDNRGIVFNRYFPTQIKAPSTPFSTTKPYLNFDENIEQSNFQYYSPDQDDSLKYKLVPYEQTPPIKVGNVLTSKKNYSPQVFIPTDSIYIKSLRPQNFAIFDNAYSQIKTRKPPTPITDVYYERRPISVSALDQPVIENGFKPIVNSQILTTEAPLLTSTLKEISYPNINEKNQDLPTIATIPDGKLKYTQDYVVEQPIYNPANSESSNSVSLAELLNSLQINKSVPKPITKENVGASIRTLLQVLSTLNAQQAQQNEVETAVLSSPKPFESAEVFVETTPSPPLTTTPKHQNLDLHDEPYLATIHPPSQHIDEYPSGGGSTQRFPLPVTADSEGGTPGRPDVDYPILTVIPPTSFDCKTQRYKGFFADTETRCQVWHYCDLNGGQASFLCPNGTIFSQAALTCDWWFNVRCASTTQLYVLNESLYKYILPHSPKFPEDYSGPLVDKYLSLKFKEMEEQFKKNKNKKVASDNVDSDESPEKDSSTEETTGIDKPKETSINQADVTIESPGSSGNVQRLQDE